MNIHLVNLKNLTDKIKGLEITYVDDENQKYNVIKNDTKIKFSGNLYNYFSNIIDEVEDFILHHSYNIESDTRTLIDKLEEFRHNFFRSEWCSSNEKILNEIKSNNFLVTKKYIIYHKNIPLQQILYKNKYYKVTDDIRIKHDLYIKSVRISLSKTFTTIILCNGIHPNIDPRDKQFCLDPVLKNLDLNFKNLMLVIESMKIANINKCYNFSVYFDIFKPLIKGEN